MFARPPHDWTASLKKTRKYFFESKWLQKCEARAISFSFCNGKPFTRLKEVTGSGDLQPNKGSKWSPVS